ncbi:tetratricopeptide repeat protein [Flavobacterium sp.]|uniref:tetratricopeptide repeat-containing sensor histidine kinase n=1 Tax=Flavobacterium sp. TaxID=239 RepID=UPI00286A20B4|nr:tetratricopeptide repeat protein [Flavobacterium sp.]
MKNLLSIFLILLLFNCNKKKESNGTVLGEDKIDTLFTKANNFKIEKTKRILYADKIINLLGKKDNDSLTRNHYFKLSDTYYNLGENEKNLQVSRMVYNMSKNRQDVLGVAKALYYIGDYHYSRFKNDSAYYYYTKSEKTYLSYDVNYDVLRIKYYKANILFFEKDFLGCETAIIEILKNRKIKNNTRLVHDCYITLGNALEGLNNSENALEYYNKAFEITSKLQDDPQYLMLKAQAYNYIGKVYQKQKNYSKSIEYFRKGLEFDDFKKTLPFLYANLINNLGYSNLKMGNESSIFQLNEGLKIRQALKNTLGIVSSKINLSEYYLDKKDTLKAFANITEAKKQANSNKIFEDELKALQLLTKIDPKNDSFYNNRFIKLTDSLQNNERATRNKFARIEFETDEITIQKNNIEAEKNKISYQRWVILGFGVFIVLVIGLLYLAKSQHSKNKELQFEKAQQKANEDIYQLMLDQQSKIDEGRQEEKKRISQELHDGIMSKLTSTRLNLFVLSKKTDEETIKKCLVHIAEIQNIEKEIRQISHNLAQDIFLGKDSFKIIIESLFESQKDISKTNFHLEIDNHINWDSIDVAIKMNIYRIFQENLQNINKYAKAKNSNANIIQHDDHIQIDITDDGVGFNVEKTKEGIGLKNMLARVNTLDGKIKIISKKGKGTHINLIIPI